jgi:hypothetical protein
VKKNRRDAMAKDLARKYHKPYSEIRKEVCRQISEYAKLINTEKHLISEDESILNYFKNKYE